MANSTNACIMPIVSKLYCATSQVLLIVRERPNVVNGGGFVATDCSQKVVFRVDGCGVLGKQGEIIVRDCDGEPLLLLRKKGGIVQALSFTKKWKGYTCDYEGSQKLLFSLKEPKESCVRMNNNAIRVSIEPRRNKRDWDFEIRGYFPDRDCSIVDYFGNDIAQIGVKNEVKEMMRSKDFYHVVVKPGIDQVFVFGVISVLDYIYGGSTSC